MSGVQYVDFLVRKSDLRVTRFDEQLPPERTPLRDGDALLRVDRFGFTANNVTYAVVGDQIGYWQFFPAPDDWGHVPVWGYGDVIRSQATGLEEGERVFGYFPMASWLRVQARPTATGFSDAAPQRASLPQVYNQYLSTRANAVYRPEREDFEILLRPLFMTSFMLEDYLADQDFFGARRAVLSSASSKTAFGTAALLAARAGRPEIVGLTSPGNVAFVERLGCYDRVVSYDAIASLPPAEPSVFVDFSGNGDVVRAAHGQLRDLRASLVVGVTHWESRGGRAELPGPAPAFFFAPTQIQKRSGDWGPRGIQERFGEAWQRLVGLCDGWLRVVRESGPSAVERVYRDVLEGRVSPDLGPILSL